MATLCLEDLHTKLQNYCNWNSLPTELLSDIKGDTTKASHDADATLAAFITHLTALLPFEWSVTQHATFPSGSSSSSERSNRLQATMHPAAVGTADGIMVFGGLQLGRLAEVKVENEASWIKESMPAGLAPDCSRVYQGTPSYASRQVLKVCPSSSKAGAAWAAEPLSPALSGGLLGHSVVLWGSRAFVFGGMQEFNNSDPTDAPARRPTNVLRAYAVDEAGTQGGLLPTLSEVPQLGVAPSCRMYHSAAVDPEGGVMYVYGGVTIVQRTNSRVPADNEPGLLHAFDFGTYTWTRISTTGDHRPCCTTLLAFFWHAGALWAIPDLPAADTGSRRAEKAAAAGYKLLRLCLDSKRWQQVPCQGEPPSHRTDSCSIFNPLSQELVVYGGKAARPPCSLLAGLHILSLPEAQQQPEQVEAAAPQPKWQRVQPHRLSTLQQSAGSSQQQQQQGMLPLAGHAGGVVSSTGEVAFVGGYRSNAVKEPQPLVQVLTKAVKPPTPDVAKLGSRVPQQQLAMQHVRMQLARMVKKAHPAQVLLKPEGAGVRLPARLLALYSCLFDDLFQAMLEEQQEEDEPGASLPQQQQQQQQIVPVPGVQQDSIAAVCRWMMGLLALRSCSVEVLVDMYRVADRLIMEQLMVEVLEELADRQLLTHEAAHVMQLAGDFPGAGTALHSNAAQQLQQQLSPSTAPAIMALAKQHDNVQLQERCVEVMLAHRKNDVFAVLDFALRFNLRSLQGSCLNSIRRASRDRLVDTAERIVQMVSRRLLHGQRLCDVPAVQMLERDLVNELEGADVHSLVSYAAICEKVHLQKLCQGLVDYLSRQEVWQQLQQEPNKGILQHLQQRHARLHTAVMQQRGGRPRTGGDAAAATNLLGGANGGGVQGMLA